MACQPVAQSRQGGVQGLWRQGTADHLMHAGRFSEERNRLFIWQAIREYEDLVPGDCDCFGKNRQRIERETLGKQPVIEILGVARGKDQATIVVCVGFPLDVPLRDAVLRLSPLDKPIHVTLLENPEKFSPADDISKSFQQRLDIDRNRVILARIELISAMLSRGSIKCLTQGSGN